MKRAALLFFFLSLTWALPVHANPVLGNPIAMAQSTAAEKSHVFKATAGYLYSLDVAISSTAGYVLLYDAATAPSDGSTTPVYCAPIVASTPYHIDFPFPFPFLTGIVAVFSTTGCFTQTGSNAFFAAQFK